MTTTDSFIYWDVYPKQIKASPGGNPHVVPLSIRGAVTTPVFESTDPLVASVDDNGCVITGHKPGAATILIYDSPEKRSIRHVLVEVIAPTFPLPVWLPWED